MTRKSILPVVLLGIFTAVPFIAAAQEAKIHIKVYPPESQIFVDAKTVGKGPAKTITTTPGSHMVIVANYGFYSQTLEVNLNAGESRPLEFTLQRADRLVSGPWGRIQIENAPGQAAVLLNGTKAGYLVGHVDMFNNANLWHQQLIVPAGKHHVTIMTRDGELWAGDIEVPANKRVILNAQKGTTTVKDWSEGANHAPMSRFAAGIASASVVVAPVTATFAVEPARINCGDKTQLTWSTQDAVDSTITANSTNLGEIPVSGERADQPLKTTSYQFQTSGPGGVLTSSATTEVNTAVQADLSASPAEVTYHRMGDKVVEQTPATLSWNSTNADAASIDPVGTVSTKGDQEVKPIPKQTADGAVNETLTYTLVTKNMCGGSETKTASVHITGIIEPIPEVPLASVFFPTGYPVPRDPHQHGLLRSQHNVLGKTAEGLKKYFMYDPDARLTLTAHADERGSLKSNQSLSERRASRVKSCLISQGIPADKIDIVAVGKTENLSPAEVHAIQEQNPSRPAFAKGNSHALVWAYNRRVDITFLPSGQKSTQFFPGDADDAKLLFKSEWQGRRSIEKAEEGAAQPAAGIN